MTEQARPRSLAALAACALLLFAGFVSLGTWQVQRLQWKRGLIERVTQRVNAPPVDAPGPERWAGVSVEGDEYRHVRVKGVFLHALSARVQAVTELGSGYWLLTPLRAEDGSVVLVNRGFIAPDAKSVGGEDKTVALTGLLRITEPGGGFLRRNDPGADRWYSRDVAAIAASRGLTQVAPYFVDADRASSEPGGPIGGLTVITFHNSHLVYALTWYALALMVLGASVWVVRHERRARRADHSGSGD
jgi:surfeit locus 1 family protein